MIMIPFAMLGLAYPVIAELAMANSSITVVTNAISYVESLLMKG